MNKELTIYNSLKRTQEKFVPKTEGYIGMYVCGPTVYSDVHLGNCRTFVSFDIIYRYLMYLGYKVRYVRNITDVGHLTGDSDDGEDKISKKAKLENLEPMEVAQKFSNGFHHMMDVFETLPPSIEPRATGHIIEQIEMVQKIIDNGFGYESNGSVYFDTLKFDKACRDGEVGDKVFYGQLSGRILDDLLAESRDLKKQNDKNHPSDFAIWMKADESHLMRWNSPWSVGFPGWHLECSAMSTKYLGEEFDIHGGGTDLKFPHHENEIAQNVGACGCSPAAYWLHANMLLMNGKKMSKSDGNTISPQGLFSGDSPHVTQGYDPMVVKFFMLQSHYRSTLDLTDLALQAADKGYKRLMEANRILQTIAIPAGDTNEKSTEIKKLMDIAVTDMNDDFNTPKALSRLFELVPIINSYQNKLDGYDTLDAETLSSLKKFFSDFLFDIFGLKDSMSSESNGLGKSMDGLMELVIDLRQSARENKDWPTSDKIRDTLQALDIQLKDGKEGTSWSLN